MTGAEQGFATRSKLIEEAVAAQAFTTLIGARIRSIAQGRCEMAVSQRPELLQQYGSFHGGVIAYLVDNACATAAATVGDDMPRPLTSEFKISFLAPARGRELRCLARVVKAGRRLVIVAADVLAVDDGPDIHVATALATISVA